MGFKIYATEDTSKFLEERQIENTMVFKVHNLQKENNILTLMQNQMLDLVINIPNEYDKKETEDDYIIRRNAVDYSIPLLTNVQVTRVFIDALNTKKISDLEIKSWDEYK